MKKTQIDIILAATLLIVTGNKSFSEDSVQQAENIQSPQLRKEISQLRATVDQPQAVWKLMGYSEKHKTRKIRTDMMFYDSSSIEILENGIIRLWIKDVDASIIKSSENDSEVINKAAINEAQGYIPPSMKIRKSEFEDTHEIILFEMVANLQRMQPKTMMQTEIDMVKKRFRTPLIRIYKPNGNIVTGTAQPDWNRIEPQSNFETLYEILKLSN
jgi:hypothetical protein